MRYTSPGEGKTLVSTLLPCRDCLKTIAAYKIKRVLYKEIYKSDPIALEIAEKMGVTVVHFEREPKTSYWDHSTKPSVFVVKEGNCVTYRGTFYDGAKLLKI